MKRRIRLIRTAFKLVKLEIRKVQKFEGVSFIDALRIVSTRYQDKAQGKK